MKQEKKINLISANMGYGHQRAAYPLLHLGADEIITINDYKGIPQWEKKYWINNLETYEKISRLKKVPIVGDIIFSAMDYMQRIKSFYPKRDLSRPTIQQLYFYKLIKKGLGKDLIDKLSSTKLPLVTTFFVAMYMAEEHKYKGDIYCIVCDADISRAWAPIKPINSKSKFFAPNQRVKERLLMYGVNKNNIYVTGFPLPQENIGEKQEILKEDLARRVRALDTANVYREKEKALLKKIVPNSLIDGKPKSLTITFAVGGAGAQKEIGAQILKQLSQKINNGEIELNLVAGVRPEIRDYFTKETEANNLILGKGVNVIYHKDKIKYFKLFNKILRKTDILWTKPSELSFYSALGLPILMSETVGSQEKFNRESLLAQGAGIDSLDPKYVKQWLPDMLNSGRLARAAMDGFLNGENQGTYNIEKILSKK
ncbi:MAG TPA: hypothetical protein VFD51_00355 [Patescibacteria group bacterium]|nr:hypothetical protein [Patescibacteria group bacterium]